MGITVYDLHILPHKDHLQKAGLSFSDDVFMWCQVKPLICAKVWERPEVALSSRYEIIYIYIHIYIYSYIYIFIGLSPHPVTVTTRIIIFLVGDPYKPSFATVTGRV